MDKSDIEVLFNKYGVIKEGHFKYTSGFHGPHYFAKELLLARISVLSFLAKEIAERFEGENIETVIGPSFGGAYLATRVAERLTDHPRDKFAVSVDHKEEGVFTIKKPYHEFIQDKKVLIVDDVLNRGHNTAKVLRLVRDLNADIVGIASIFSYGHVTAKKFDVPRVEALLTVRRPVYIYDKCPMCERGIPLDTDFGHGGKS